MHKSRRMLEELENAVKAFEKDIETGPLTPAEIERLERARRGVGFSQITLTLERSLVKRIEILADLLGCSHSDLVTRAVQEFERNLSSK